LITLPFGNITIISGGYLKFIATRKVQLYDQSGNQGFIRVISIALQTTDKRVTQSTEIASAHQVTACLSVFRFSSSCSLAALSVLITRHPRVNIKSGSVRLPILNYALNRRI
jgi:hypothetical protein